MDVLGKYVVMIMSVVDMYIQDVDLLAVAYFYWHTRKPQQVNLTPGT